MNYSSKELVGSKLFEEAFFYAPIGLVVTQNRIIQECNLSFAAMFGYSRHELIHQLFAILYPTEEEFSSIRGRGIEELRQKNVYWDERIMARKNGSLFWCRVRGNSFTPQQPLEKAIWSFADLSDERPYVPLTKREKQVVARIADGLTSKQIARDLGLSYRTIEIYRSRLLKKFGVQNTSALIMSLGSICGPHIVER
ncbi:LuxR C-terminal-related transcriptional regulator [Polycladidibacter stylochi]|uniref:LuxR C-terminal-related transcriptional regulator n=1 Tax=Polycladidibacter stylochi TaxID=1807766 RepID=UPI000829B403|nr:LuxR C-terminal-related transcriptional regulator [Pseudovibrio stylochi]